MNKKIILWIFAFVLLVSFASADLTDGLVLYSKMDDTTYTLIDSSVFGNTADTSSIAVNRTGIINQSVYFNSAGLTYANYSDESQYDITGNLTISVWFKEDTSTIANAGLLSKYCNHAFCGGTTQRSYSLVFKDDNTLQFALSSSGDYETDEVITSSAISEGEWTHAVAVFKEGQEQSIYINGVLNVTKTSSVIANIYSGSAYVMIGNHYDSAGEYKGDIDDTALWNRSLSSDEILELYYLGMNGTTYPFTAETPTNDTTAPILSIVYPTNQSSFNVSLYTGYLNYTTNENANISINDSRFDFIGTNGTTIFSYVNNSAIGIGNHTLMLNITDNVSNSALFYHTFELLNDTTTPVTPPVNDTTNPTVTLTNPGDLSTDTDGSINFTATVSDDIYVFNVSLWSNFTGTWALNQTNISTGESASYGFDLTLGNGTYIWNIEACDNSSNCAFDSANFTVDVSISAPGVSVNTSAYNSTLPTDWAKDFDVTSTAGVLMLFFYLALIVVVFSMGMILGIPILVFLASAMMFFLGFILAFKISILFGVLVVLVSICLLFVGALMV